jgi:hypothetical protein
MFSDADLEKIGEALRQQSEIDYRDAGPKAPHGDIAYRGVWLSSRYDVAAEFDHMKAVIDGMPELMARRIESIQCDSKACAYYSVEIRPGKFLNDLPMIIETTFKRQGGFNGLSITCPGEQAVDLDPFWPGDHRLFVD